MHNQELINVLRLIRSENIGPRTFYDLLKHCGTVKTALEMAPKMSLRGGKSRPITICSEKQALEEFNDVNKFGAKLISYQDPLYPTLLKNIYDPPPILTVLGNNLLLNSSSVAIVGARNASINSCKYSENLSSELGKRGVTIVSGLAKGIDGFAHKGALETGTVAVVAGGINKIYPLENEKLFYEIAKKGCIIAESPFNSIPRAQNFPQRNRIISGISLGTVVIEAAIASGSLITARFAAEQGREVFAVPGSPMDPRSTGNNQLLKEGAKLVTCADDVLDEIKNLNLKLNERNIQTQFDSPALNIEEKDLIHYHNQLLNYLDSYPIDIDLLIEVSRIPFNIALLLITELELAGRLMRYSNNKISLIY